MSGNSKNKADSKHVKHRKKKYWFSKKVTIKCRLTNINSFKQNNEHTWVMLKIQFRSSFKHGYSK